MTQSPASAILFITCSPTATKRSVSNGSAPGNGILRSWLPRQNTLTRRWKVPSTRSEQRSTVEHSTLAAFAISCVKAWSQSFQPSRLASSQAISPPPLPYSRSTVMMRYIALYLPLFYPDLGFDRHSGAQDVLFGFSGIEGDFHRNSLNHLHVVAGGILGRKQAGDGAARAGKALHVSVVIFAVGV